MTVQTPQNQPQNTEAQKPSDKELNFRALEQRYERQLAAEREARQEAERKAQEAQRSKLNNDEDDEDSEPYVDPKTLKKQLNKFGQTTQSEIQKAMEFAKQKAKEELKQEMWLEQNPDFFDTMQNHAERFAQKAPKLAETILKMPEGFERQKLVYQNIKELGLDKPEQKQPSIQEKIEANRKSPYYQPGGVGQAPYAPQGDFSASGQKQAYAKLQELKSRLRI